MKKRQQEGERQTNSLWRVKSETKRDCQTIRFGGKAKKTQKRRSQRNRLGEKAKERKRKKGPNDSRVGGQQTSQMSLKRLLGKKECEYALKAANGGGVRSAVWTHRHQPHVHPFRLTASDRTLGRERSTKGFCCQTRRLCWNDVPSRAGSNSKSSSRSFVDWFKEVQPAVIPGNHDTWLDDSTESVQHGEAAEIAGPYDFLFWRSDPTTLRPCKLAITGQKPLACGRTDGNHWHEANAQAVSHPTLAQTHSAKLPRQSMLKRTAPVALSGKSRRSMVEKMRPWNRTQVWQLAPEVLDRPRARRLHHRTATIKNSRQCSSERSFVGVFQTRRQMGNLHTKPALVSVAKFSTCRSAADRPAKHSLSIWKLLSFWTRAASAKGSPHCCVSNKSRCGSIPSRFRCFPLWCDDSAQHDVVSAIASD